MTVLEVTDLPTEPVHCPICPDIFCVLLNIFFGINIKISSLDIFVFSSRSSIFYEFNFEQNFFISTIS